MPERNARKRRVTAANPTPTASDRENLTGPADAYLQLPSGVLVRPVVTLQRDPISGASIGWRMFFPDKPQAGKGDQPVGRPPATGTSPSGDT